MSRPVEQTTEIKDSSAQAAPGSSPQAPPVITTESRMPSAGSVTRSEKTLPGTKQGAPGGDNGNSGTSGSTGRQPKSAITPKKGAAATKFAKQLNVAWKGMDNLVDHDEKTDHAPMDIDEDNDNDATPPTPTPTEEKQPLPSAPATHPTTPRRPSYQPGESTPAATPQRHHVIADDDDIKSSGPPASASEGAARSANDTEDTSQLVCPYCETKGCDYTFNCGCGVHINCIAFQLTVTELKKGVEKCPACHHQPTCVSNRALLDKLALFWAKLYAPTNVDDEDDPNMPKLPGFKLAITAKVKSLQWLNKRKMEIEDQYREFPRGLGRFHEMPAESTVNNRIRDFEDEKLYNPNIVNEASRFALYQCDLCARDYYNKKRAYENMAKINAARIHNSVEERTEELLLDIGMNVGDHGIRTIKRRRRAVAGIQEEIDDKPRRRKFY